jgi:hypothetical protein
MIQVYINEVNRSLIQDVAQAVKMLVYNNSITGHNLVVDAGFTAS